MMTEPVPTIIWAVPRSRSNALTKSLSGIPNSKIFHELYTNAFYFGPDSRVSPASNLSSEATSEVDKKINEGGCVFPTSVTSYDWVKNTLARDYPGKSVISKEISFCLDYKYDSLPKGYRHIFLIRHPRDVFLSWKRMDYEISQAQSNQAPVPFKDYQFDNAETISYTTVFKQSYDLYQYLKKNHLDENPVIIDGDDLMNDPAGMLAALCDKLGLPYSDHLLTWDKGISDTWTISDKFKHSIETIPTLEGLRESTGFKRRSPDKGASSGDVDITADIQRCIDPNTPFYLKMYEQRLKVDHS
ncbi:uncharacterized protein [Asterias amurensis]|uniref:uncharacterized protein n=1 Tax=Asterias amurensis TaxID=7602 RepID=UPI003AB272CE